MPMLELEPQSPMITSLAESLAQCVRRERLYRGAVLENGQPYNKDEVLLKGWLLRRGIASFAGDLIELHCEDIVIQVMALK